MVQRVPDPDRVEHGNECVIIFVCCLPFNRNRRHGDAPPLAPTMAGDFFLQYDEIPIHPATARMPSPWYDVLIIGSGASGLSLALRLADQISVAVISKTALIESNTL